MQDPTAYRAYLEAQPSEWAVLDSLCRISISRFYRDRRLFDVLGQQVLLELAEASIARREPEVRVWSAGCASGEEPYTLAMLWQANIQPRYPMVRLKLIASDIDEQFLERARRALYPASSVKDAPEGWKGLWLIPEAAGYRVAWPWRSQQTQPACPCGCPGCQ